MRRNAENGATTHLTANDEKALFNSNYLIYALCDQQGNIWTGTEGGIARIMRGNNLVRTFGQNDVAAERCALLTPQGSVLIGTINGLLVQHPATLHPSPVTRHPSPVITDLHTNGQAGYEGVKEEQPALVICDCNFNIDQLATMMNMGRTKFFGKVKDMTGLSPNKYLLKMRMEKAADLLADGELNVSEVSYKVGIQDPSYFNKLFKSYYGVMPSKYVREATLSCSQKATHTPFFTLPG